MKAPAPPSRSTPSPPLQAPLPQPPVGLPPPIQSQPPQPPDPTTRPNLRDYHGEDYRTFWEGAGRVLLERLELGLVARLLPPGPGWLIDLGCGYGRLVPAYRRPDRRIVLVDYAENLLEMAVAAYAGPGVHFVLADVGRLPFRGGVFDLGVSVRVFHHMEAPRAFLQELSRSLRPAGQAVVSYSNKRNPARILRRGLRCFRRDHEAYAPQLYGTHPRFFVDLCQDVGLEVTGLEGTGVLDQVLRSGPGLERLIEASSPMSGVVSALEALADAVLGPAGLAPLEFAALRKRAGEQGPAGSGLEAILACPGCRGASLEIGSDGVRCHGCGARYSRRGQIYDFRIAPPPSASRSFRHG